MALERAPRIDYNIASALLKARTTGGLKDLGKIVEIVGIEGVSVLPLRTAELVDTLTEYFPQVTFVEGAWNPGNSSNLVAAAWEGLSGLGRRVLKHDPTEPPLPQDTLFFPPKTTSEELVGTLMTQFGDALFMTTEVESLSEEKARYGGRVVAHAQRLHLPHQLTKEEVLARAQAAEIQLVWDATHPVTRPSHVVYPDGHLAAQQDEILQELLYFGKQVGVVDLHGVVADLKQLVAGTGLLNELAYEANRLGVEATRLEFMMPVSAQISPFGYEDYFNTLADTVNKLHELRSSFL